MNYYICDKCGNLANITDEPLPEAETWVCDECSSEALWHFTDKDKALAHSAMIRDKLRPATDEDATLIARLADERGLIAPGYRPTRANARAIIEQLQAGTYDPEEWTVPF